MFYYNPLDTACKSVIGAVRQGTKVKIKVFTDLPSVTLNVVADDGGMKKAYPMTTSKGGLFACIDLPVGLYWYYFTAPSLRYGRGKDMKAQLFCEDNFQLSVYKKSYVSPSLLRGSVVYQIFPDRFCKSGDFTVEEGKEKRSDWGGEPKFRDPDGEVRNNEFFGGNFKGIKSKLSYLKKLGVNVIYLNPIGKAYSSHRYDTGDYLTFDPVLGTEDDLKDLIAAAKKKGISFIFDGVYNHTGADSLYFNRYGNYPEKGAFNSKKSPYYKWYHFTDYPKKYSAWWDFETLPAIKKKSKEFQEFVCEKVLPKYYELGFSGVRLDVVDEITDKFVKNIKKVTSKYSKDYVVIGEVWEDATNKIAYGERRKYFLGEELDSVMNYPLREAIVSYLLTANTYWLVNVMNEQLNNFSQDNLNSLLNVLSTHDTPRLITVLGRNKVVLDKDLLKYEKLDAEQYENGKTLAKLAYTITYTCYGAPCVYYGDEAGLTGDLDPYNRRCYPWGKEDKDMQEYVARLSHIRKTSKAVREGKFEILYHDKQVIVYLKSHGAEKVVVAISRNPSAVKLRLDGLYAEFGSKDYRDTFELKADGTLILRAKNG